MPQDDDDDDDNEMGCILKKGTHFTALYTQKLGFFDIRNCLLPSGFSYAKYLSIYSGPACQGWKSLFPYAYVEDLPRLRDPLLPYDTF